MAEKIIGIEDRSELGSMHEINPGDILEYVRQLHRAKRAGKHYDWRIGNKKLGLLSWATRKDYPTRGKAIELFRQPIHTYDYKDFEGTIPAGYGEGTVRKADEGRILITKKKGDKLSFTVAHKQNPQRFAIIPKDGNALMVKAKDPEAPKAKKPKFKNIPSNRVSVYVQNLGKEDIAQPKVDGSFTLFPLLKNKDIEALSWRTSKRTGGPIWHTERFWGRRPTLEKLPKKYVGTTLLGEMYGERKGKVVPVQMLGGILNSTVATSLERQKKDKVKLKALLFDITGKPVEGKSYEERLEELKKIVSLLPDSEKFAIPETVKGPEAAKSLLERIRSGKHPLTTEGLVIRKKDGEEAKAKLMDETDVYIREVFPGEGKYKNKAAGGFEYSHTPDGPIVGKCGTGMVDQLRKDMWANPQQYLGRVARVKYQAIYRKTGALRVPVLIAIHESK